MKATGNFEAARNVDPLVALTDATRAHIDHWVAKFPPDRKRSAVLQGLHAAQEQNGGWQCHQCAAGHQDSIRKGIGLDERTSGEGVSCQFTTLRDGD